MKMTATEDLAAAEAAGLTAYRLKYQGEWWDTDRGHAKLDFLQKYLSH
jgi:hypothetical protein